jgi:hypothetical protein
MRRLPPRKLFEFGASRSPLVPVLNQHSVGKTWSRSTAKQATGYVPGAEQEMQGAVEI